MSDLGITVLESTEKRISIRRLTRESEIVVTLDDSPRRDFQLDTGIDFFNHMIEHIAWRSCLNIDVQYTNTQFRLTHVITEDTGIVMGMAFAELIKNKMASGVEGAGSGILGIDEAMALSNVSFEGRSVATFNFDAAPGLAIPQLEDALSADLKEFFRGFVQGARATVFIQAFGGEDPHHCWESVYRSFGLALKEALKPNPWRAGTTAGVKGTME